VNLLPVCAEDRCNQKLALFVQIELEDRFGLPFESGSILSIFQCIKLDDPFEALVTQFPKNPWTRRHGSSSSPAPAPRFAPAMICARCAPTRGVRPTSAFLPSAAS
jgi:hypothetical protein